LIGRGLVRDWPRSDTTISCDRSAGPQRARRARTRERSAEKGRVAVLSLLMLNRVLEATLAFMVLLLAMSVAAIIRVGPAPTGTTEANSESETMAPGPPRPIRTMPAPATIRGAAAMPGPAMWPGAIPNGAPPAPPAAVRRTSWLAKVRYEGSHARGRVPRQRPPTPAGPPWGPAAPPPVRPPQGSERWT
jgi:uncharacterized iron-regulated membrane protein